MENKEIYSLLKHKEKADFFIDKISRIPSDVDLGEGHELVATMEGLIKQLKYIDGNIGAIFYYDIDDDGVRQMAVQLSE